MRYWQSDNRTSVQSCPLYDLPRKGSGQTTLLQPAHLGDPWCTATSIKETGVSTWWTRRRIAPISMAGMKELGWKVVHNAQWTWLITLIHILLIWIQNKLFLKHVFQLVALLIDTCTRCLLAFTWKQLITTKFGGLYTKAGLIKKSVILQKSSKFHNRSGRLCSAWILWITQPVWGYVTTSASRVHLG